LRFGDALIARKPCLSLTYFLILSLIGGEREGLQLFMVKLESNVYVMTTTVHTRASYRKGNGKSQACITINIFFYMKSQLEERGATA
jgi:hypothetical protein